MLWSLPHDRVFEVGSVSTGSESMGGLLGLEMGMGKTLVMIAAHALEQHTLPEKPAMHTQWTAAELREYEDVLVGKDMATAKERQCFTGFKQLEDDVGTIVHDGSVRPSRFCISASATSTLDAGVPVHCMWEVVASSATICIPVQNCARAAAMCQCALETQHRPWICACMI